MSLLSIMQLSTNALTANQLGIRVVGNNIANANTPGYIRQDLVLQTAPSVGVGAINFGMGVEVQGVVQRIDNFVAERLRRAKGELQGGLQEKNVYEELESILGELNDSDLSTSLSSFFSSISDIANQPDSVAVRNVAVLEGQKLTNEFRKIDTQVREVRQRVNDQLEGAVGDVNRLLHEISDLNVNILEAEGGLISKSAAVGLRDQRLMALQKLSELIDIRAVEQEKGTVSVYAGGEFLVFDATVREIGIKTESNRGLPTYNLVLKDTDGEVGISSGKIHGMLEARDTILGGFIDELDSYAKSLISEFNKVFSSGQGLTGYSELTSEHLPLKTDVPLDEAGLPFPVENGSFEVLTYDTETKQTRRTRISVEVNGLEDDTSVEDIRKAIDAIDGLTARYSNTGELTIESERPNLQFAFSKDSSGFLAGIGLGGFFTGMSAGSININSTFKSDPGKFSASEEGIAVDSKVAVKLADFANLGLASLSGKTITEEFEQLTITVTQRAAAANAIVDGLETFHNTIEAQHLSITGVSLDEEAVKLITYQKAFAASARVIKTASDLLDILVNL